MQYSCYVLLSRVSGRAWISSYDVKNVEFYNHLLEPDILSLYEIYGVGWLIPFPFKRAYA